MRIARRAKRAYVLGVVPIMARCAGVIACWRGTFMRAASQRHSPARPTRPCSRPLRAIAGILAVVVVRSRRLMGNPLGGSHQRRTIGIIARDGKSRVAL